VGAAATAISAGLRAELTAALAPPKEPEPIPLTGVRALKDLQGHLQRPTTARKSFWRTHLGERYLDCATPQTHGPRRGSAAGHRVSLFTPAAVDANGRLEFRRAPPHAAPPSRPEVPAESVRTPVVASQRCPVCGLIELRGRQTVCSAACRRRRSRDRQLTALQARDSEIRALLETALRKLEEGAP